MIDITIKTLDSRNHVFSVEDELTVKQLKEKIAEPVNVPADSQRLIYCGRVLVDDKKLSEYDVHGKVIHLVQRAPPTSSDSSNSGNEPRTTTSTRRGAFRTILAPGSRVSMDGGSGNAMYLGAMAFPADLMDAQGISMPQPRHRLSQSRLSVARGMLRRARYTLLNLENPTHQESPQEINANTEDFRGNIATAAAFAAAVAGTSNVGVQHPPPPHINIESTVGEGEMQADDPEPTPDGNSPDESPSGEEATPNANGDTTENLRNGRYRFPGPVHMAELIAYIREIERRLSPFLERFHELVRHDPVLENPAEAQRLFDQVSKLLHFLSHAYHAISDIMCDFSTPPPRRLRCRPVLIQHSAVLQTGIPLQAQVNMGASSSNSNSQNSQSASSGPEVTTADANNTSSETITEESNRPQSQPSSQENNSNTGGRSGNLGGNFEFYMDVGQGSITIDSMEATLVTNSGQGGTETTGTITSGPFPWGSPPPPEFLQSLMQAVAGHMIGGSTSASSSANANGSVPTPSNPTATGSSPGAGEGGLGSGGGPTVGNNSAQASQPPTGEPNVTNSQARGNTSTQPTTSTQTRSTTRPHVHIAPGFQGMGVPGFFDPFLPCNSHHIHGTRRRTEPQETSNSSNPSSQSTSQSTGTSTESPPRQASEPPSIVNWFSNLLQGLRGGTGQGQGPSLIRILPRDVTVFLQGSPPMPNLTTLPVHTTVAELLQSSPDHSYTEGASLFSDFVMTLARNLRVIDVLNMGSPNSSVLISLRPVLRDFIRNRLLGGREGNQAVSDAVNRINSELRPLIESICAQEDIPFRDDVDIIATINQLNHTTIPILIRDVLEEDDNQFTRNIPNHCNDYARHLASILLYCCQNGQLGLESIYTTVARRATVGVPQALQNWSVVNIVNQLRAMTHGLDTSSESIQPYLVFRMAEAPPENAADQPQAMETEVSGETVTPSNLQPTPTVQQSIPVPRVLSPISVSPPLPLQQPEAEQLPDVILGAEQWHNSVPPDWVPIITRDRERQRRQAVQGPLSDAYLSGMPSKRRKVVASTKPHTNLARVITESMNSALGAAGVACVEPGLAETAGGDTSLRAAYKEQVRTTLAPTLRHHPDFTPEKYPAAAKLFTPK